MNRFLDVVRRWANQSCPVCLGGMVYKLEMTDRGYLAYTCGRCKTITRYRPANSQGETAEERFVDRVSITEELEDLVNELLDGKDEWITAEMAVAEGRIRGAAQRLEEANQTIKQLRDALERSHKDNENYLTQRDESIAVAKGYERQAVAWMDRVKKANNAIDQFDRYLNQVRKKLQNYGMPDEEVIRYLLRQAGIRPAPRIKPTEAEPRAEPEAAGDQDGRWIVRYEEKKS